MNTKSESKTDLSKVFQNKKIEYKVFEVRILAHSLRLLNGEIIPRCPYENLFLYILFKNGPEQSGYIYDIIRYIYLFLKFLEVSQ